MGHDGPGHVAIAQEQPTLRALQLYHGKRGAGLSVEFKVRYGPVTIVGCTQTADGRLKLLAAEGESIPGETFRIGNTNSRLRFGHRPPSSSSAGASRARPTTSRSASATSARDVHAIARMLELEYAEVDDGARLLPAAGRPERLDEYKARHRDVWPEMRDALREAGWGNYSLFLRDDGLLVGYVETEDFEAAQRAMAATDVNDRWQAGWRLLRASAPTRGSCASRRSSTLVSYPPSTSAPTSGRVVRGRWTAGGSNWRRCTASTTGRCACPTACAGTCCTCSPRRSPGCAARARLAGVGVDTWGVDYALLDGGTRPRAPVPLPRRPHRRDDRARVRARTGRAAVRRHRHPDDADQHRLPAPRRRGLGRAGGRASGSR